MTLREAIYITTVFEEGTLSGAAERLYVCRQVIGRAVSSVEKRTGRPLFIRTAGRLTPTKECENLVADVRPLLSAWNSFNDRYDKVDGQ